MAVNKPAAVITQERHEISAICQRILDIFDHAQHAGAIDNIALCRPTSDRQAEIAMAVKKPEVVISQECNEIAAKSQRLPHIFGDGGFNGAIADVSRQPEIAMAAFKDGINRK